MLKVGLFGATGNIGLELHDYLNKKYSVIPFGSKNSKDLSNLVVLDLKNAKEVHNFIKETDYINIFIYLVGLAHTKGTKSNKNKFDQINSQTLFNLLNACKMENKVPQKIIFASTISVYGESLNDKYYPESKICKPRTPYSKTKLNSENFLINNFKKKTWVLRLAPVYSTKFCLNINRRIKLFSLNYKVGDGECKLSMCNMQNISYTTDAIIENRLPFGIYNLSDKKTYTYNDLINFKSTYLLIKIPKLFFKIIYYFGKVFQIPFLIENSIKLISDNTYPSNKLRKYISPPFNLIENRSA